MNAKNYVVVTIDNGTVNESTAVGPGASDIEVITVDFDVLDIEIEDARDMLATLLGLPDRDRMISDAIYRLQEAINDADDEDDDEDDPVNCNANYLTHPINNEQ